MPRTSRYILLPAGDLPGTLKRSPKEAREIFTSALAAAVQIHGPGDEAVRAAYTELKRTFEKRDDRWVPRSASPPEG